MEPDSPIPALQELASRMSSDVVRALAEAYAIGREDMKRELMAVLSPSSPDRAGTSVSWGVKNPVVIPQTAGKLPPGTVKPTILKLVMDTPGGIPTEEIIAKTGFKENSVRGTLSGLLKLGQVFRSGKYWVANAEAPSVLTEEAS
jgi:hypothetical protein